MTLIKVRSNFNSSHCCSIQYSLFNTGLYHLVNFSVFLCPIWVAFLWLQLPSLVTDFQNVLCNPWLFDKMFLAFKRLEAVSVSALLNESVADSRSRSVSFRQNSGANFPPIFAANLLAPPGHSISPDRTLSWTTLVSSSFWVSLWM